ncbi:hypothetical protein KXD97_20065 [Mycobacterium sp. SMC-8]|uniref:hypothetical protein n=1 Tax=Mycobacterium sp. SMC-8 TaxID=2857060 RepID=UPI0021B24E5B|nr:hypothetical protein [Mycobacterium sp. SMC-8]UXA10408.1 hypothetical protein KXD97_20065 [Mycobacterium sp. SMC-8]
MSVVRRGRSFIRRGAKVQRRVALVQLLFWPVLVGSGLAAGATDLALRRHRTATTPTAA